MSSDYIKNLPFKMQAYYESHPHAKEILEAYNKVDPLHVYYGDDLNPDEYLGYAERFIKNYEKEMEISDAVVLSFWASQWYEAWVTPEHAKEITKLILEVLPKYKST